MPGMAAWALWAQSSRSVSSATAMNLQPQTYVLCYYPYKPLTLAENYSLTKLTVAPGLIIPARRSASQLVMRKQPCEPVLPIISAAFRTPSILAIASLVITKRPAAFSRSGPARPRTLTMPTPFANSWSPRASPRTTRRRSSPTAAPKAISSTITRSSTASAKAEWPASIAPKVPPARSWP